jgi:peptidyl-prolyl cis-trans isomerase D
MLDLIRKKQKSAIVKLVFWAIIATFVGTIFLVWGKGSDGGAGGDPTVAATVNKTKISFDDYQSAYSNLYNLYQNIYRDQFTPAMEKQLGLRQQALDSLVDQTLLLQEADRRGLKVGDKELVDAIAAIPTFQENGTFSKNRYLQVLSFQRLTPDSFETMQRRQLLVEKLQKEIETQIQLSDPDLEQEYRDQNEKVNLAFVRLAPALYESKVSLTEEALQSFFEQKKEDFRIPERLSLRYLVFDPARYEQAVTFDDAEVEKYYRRHLDRFEIPEQIKVAHILVKVPADADPATREAKRALAEKILAEAKAGKEFAFLARTHSDDAGSAAQGGALDYFRRGTMVEAFETAAFALRPGELSGLVETPFGFHIIQGAGHIEAGVKPLADVAEAVKAGLRVEKAQQLALEKAMDAYNINRKDGSLENAAKANDLDLKETGFFARNDVIDGLGEAPAVSAAAFALEGNELARPVSTPQGILLFAVKERQESRIPELTEVRAQVEAAYRAEQSTALARQSAEAMVQALKQGESLESLARKEGQKLEETGFFTRSYGAFIPRLGSSEAIAKAAFALTAEQPALPQVEEVADKFVVAALKAREAADMSGLTAEKQAELRTTLLAKRKDEAIAAKLEELKAKADISVAPTILTAIEGN